ncbi:helix-turn-helix domain-containing protein, partial [Acidobacteriota bacterium]
MSVFRQSVKRPRLSVKDRVFWVWLARIWRGWRNYLVVVKPETVVKWHRKGFKLYWRWKSRKRKPGRPKVEYEIRELIQRMLRENPTWGAPRIQSELHLLGFTVAESTVSKYLIRRSRSVWFKNSIAIEAARHGKATARLRGGTRPIPNSQAP